jgi:rhamnosyltransferase
LLFARVNIREACLSSTKLDISIIIVIKNGARTIDRVLSSIFNQATPYTYEVIAVDSGSTDGTVEIMSKYPVRLYKIPSEEFSHSKTRNLGAAYSKAERYLIFLNADAVPSDDEWLNNMIRSIEYKPDLKAACAIELYEQEEFFNVTGIATLVFHNSVVEGIHIIEPFTLSKYSSIPKERLRDLFPFTTVCAIFDKKHFEKYPFDVNVPWAEDLYWVVKNSNMGFTSACSSFAKVYHYHDFYGPVGNYVPDSSKIKKVIKEVDSYTDKAYRDLLNVGLQETRKKIFNKKIKGLIKRYIG